MTPVATSTRVRSITAGCIKLHSHCWAIELERCSRLVVTGVFLCLACGWVNAGGMDSANPEHLDVVPTASVIGVTADQCGVVLSLSLPEHLVGYYGAPAIIVVRPFGGK